MNSSSRSCPVCRGLLPADAPQGLCPSCLLKGALADTSLSDETAPAFAIRPPVEAALTTRLHYFGDYELIGEIARGGMGVVYRARQVSLNRTVAVKMILSGQFAGDADVKRFRVEAEAAANLQHPHIVAIHEIGAHEGRHYFSMDFIEGKNLAAHLAERPTRFSALEIAQLVKTLAEAVHYAHQRGTLHRDLKPQNVLIDAQEQPHITDFGLAKRWDATAVSPSTSGTSSDLTHTGAIMGSPSYMAPEQATARSGEIGPPTDVYSLGAILYQLLTGQPPHSGTTPLDTLVKVVEEEPAAPHQLKPEVPTDLEVICLKCLEKKPERRYATARQLAEELGRFLHGEPILAKPASPTRKVWSWALRHPWVITGSASLVILGLCASTYGLWEKTQYLAWLAAHPRQIPFNYWPTLRALELPDAFLLLGTVLMLANFFCLYDLPNRIAYRAPLGGLRLGTYGTIALGYIGCIFYGTAKLVKICVWTDAPLSLIGGFILYLQFLFWGDLQMLWDCRRAQQRSQSGAEPPPDFLTGLVPARIELKVPYSALTHLRATLAALASPQRKPVFLERSFGWSMLTALLALSLASLWLAPHGRPLWVVSALLNVVLVHYFAGVINPRWAADPTLLERTTPNAARIAFVGLLLAVGAYDAIWFALPQVHVGAVFAGLAMGILLVLGRFRLLQRVASAENTSPPA